MRPLLAPILATACLWLAACVSEDHRRIDGVTTSAGNAIAENTAMQMVDPWPEGVQDTDLHTPAERPEGTDEAEGGANTDDSSVTDY